MRPEELPEVLALEARAFEHPWTEQNMRGELDGAHSHVALLRDADGSLLGYVVYWIVVDEATVLRVAVEPSRRRQGFAKRLVDDVLTQARGAGCRTVNLEVRRSNSGALGLYEGAGFNRIAVRAGYYRQPTEDAIVMQLALG